MNRIEHKTVGNIEKKLCSKCKKYVSVKNYNKNCHTWDGLELYCRDCSKDRSKNARWCALDVYRNILKRVNTYPHYLAKGIKCNISKEDFLKWYIPKHFHRCLLDRINNDGHYEIKNIQLINRVDHNYKLRKDNLKAIGIVEQEGFRYCYSCGSIKQNDEFGMRKDKISKLNILGLREECKQCRRAKRNKRYQNHKGEIP